MFEIMPYGHRRVVAYNPFRELEEMSRSFWNDTNLNAFRTDITEKDGVYTLTAELPGFKKEDTSIDIDKDCLTIAAERKDESEDEEQVDLSEIPLSEMDFYQLSDYADQLGLDHRGIRSKKELRLQIKQHM